VDLNLDTLKREILDYLEASGLAVFHSSPGSMDGLPVVHWDTEHFPDFHAFLDVARKTGTAIVLFATAEFEAEEIDAVLAGLEDCDLTRDERRDYEARLRDMRIFAGVTCSLELGFDYNSRLHVYEVQPDWYEEFLSIEDEISAIAMDEDVDTDSLGGYFSKN
jgi:hypothetical protein